MSVIIITDNVDTTFIRLFQTNTASSRKISIWYIYHCFTMGSHYLSLFKALSLSITGFTGSSGIEILSNLIFSANFQIQIYKNAKREWQGHNIRMMMISTAEHF